jgi:hypothetical protein
MPYAICTSVRKNLLLLLRRRRLPRLLPLLQEAALGLAHTY